MDTVNLIKSLRYLIANDSTLQGATCFNKSTSAEMLKVLIYSDGIFASKADFHSYPMLSIRLDDDEDHLRGSDSNTVPITMTIHTPTVQDGAIIRNNRIKDRLKLLLRDNHEEINSQATALSINLKVRDCQWVGAVTYEDKELGSERLHKIICNVKLILGD
jgi:hypothetical protein